MQWQCSGNALGVFLECWECFGVSLAYFGNALGMFWECFAMFFCCSPRGSTRYVGQMASKNIYQGAGKSVKGGDNKVYLLCCTTLGTKQIGCATTFLEGLYMLPIESLVQSSHGVDATDPQQSKDSFKEAIRVQQDPKVAKFGQAEVSRGQGCRIGFLRRCISMNKQEFQDELNTNPTIRTTRYI